MREKGPHVLAETRMSVKLERCGAVDSRTVVSATIHNSLFGSFKVVFNLRRTVVKYHVFIYTQFEITRKGNMCSCAYAIKTFMDLM